MDWISEQIEIIKRLENETITGYVVSEEAFFGGEEDGEGPPIFYLPEIPFLQVGLLYLKLNSGKVVKFLTYDDIDLNCGIYLSSEIRDSELELSSPYSNSSSITRELKNFPLGKITSIKVFQDSLQNISEILINISGTSILLIPGETFERFDGGLDIVTGEANIFLFKDPNQKKVLNSEVVVKNPTKA